ncbi:MAG: NlpC/P60 family protein [Bacteroidota bacterium]
MQRKIIRIAAAGICLLSSLFAASKEEGMDGGWQRAPVDSVILKIRKQFAPDFRLTLFRVTSHVEKSRVVLEGFVESQQARAAVLQAVRRVAKSPVVDKIVVVPDATLRGKTKGIVRVSVGNLRAEPEHSSELVSQVLMGMVLELLHYHDGWFLAHAPDRYIGWIESSSIVQGDNALQEEWLKSKRIIVTSLFSVIRSRMDVASEPVSDAVTGCLLRARGEASNGWVPVALPDGREGYILEADVMLYERWKGTRVPTPESILSTAKMFMGVPYLWGGTSSKGFDCSGFTKTVFALQGIELPRDAGQQYEVGAAIDPGAHLENLRKGDLLFFGRKGKHGAPDTVVHVAIYDDSSRYIHCAGMVQENSFDSSRSDFNAYRLRTFLGARRILSK